MRATFKQSHAQPLRINYDLANHQLQLLFGRWRDEEKNPTLAPLLIASQNRKQDWRYLKVKAAATDLTKTLVLAILCFFIYLPCKLNIQLKSCYDV